MQRSRSVGHVRESSVIRLGSFPGDATSNQLFHCPSPRRLFGEGGSVIVNSGSCEQTVRPKVDMVRQSSGVLFNKAKPAVTPRTLPPPPTLLFGVPGDFQRTRSADTVAMASSPVLIRSSRSLSSKTVRADMMGLGSPHNVGRSQRRMSSSDHIYRTNHGHDIVCPSPDAGASESKPLSRTSSKWPSRLRLSLDSVATIAIMGPCPSSPPPTLAPTTSVNSQLLLDLLSQVSVLADAPSSPHGSNTPWTGQEPQDDLCHSRSVSSPVTSLSSGLNEPASPVRPTPKPAPAWPPSMGPAAPSSSNPPAPSSRARRFFSFRQAFLFSRCITPVADQVEEHDHLPMQPCMIASRVY